jgi:FdhE protein
MSVTATVKVMSPEEIAALSGGDTPFLHAPQRNGAFAERQMRLRQLAQSHPMGDFLRFASDLARAQQAQLDAFTAVPLPDGAALDWPRDPAWRSALRALVADLGRNAPGGVQPVLLQLAAADDDWLEAQADALINGVMAGVDLAAAPMVAAALQVYWTHMALEVQRLQGGPAFGRTDDPTACPCCGSRPTASITRQAGGAAGQRYLHCSLCGQQWHLGRMKCPHCLATGQLVYHSLMATGADPVSDGQAVDRDAADSRAAQASVQAEACEACGHYLKIVHAERDPFVEPTADDLATLTLDLLVSDAGPQRHGVNLLLLFGEPEAPPDPSPGGP